MNNDEIRAKKKVVIDPGHGGTDPGTSGNGIVEKDYTLKISEYMKNRFDELGVESALTRDSDISLSPTDRPKKIQSIYGNGSDVVVVSNHINAGGGDGHCGKLTFFEKNRQVSIQSFIKYTYFLNYKTY